MLLLAAVPTVFLLGVAGYAIHHRWWLIAVFCVATAFDVAVLWWDGYKAQAERTAPPQAKGTAA